MKDSTLLPILKSQTQADLLALLYLNPDREFSVTEVARRIGCSVPGAHHEVVRLVDSGFIGERREGNSRLVSAVNNSILTQGLTLLLTATHGPLPILSAALEGVSGITEAYIFGSWAARYLGVAGGVPNDIDVLVVGDVDKDLLYKISEDTSKVLGRDVNIRRVSRAAWRSSTDGFLSTVRENPLVSLANTDSSHSASTARLGKSKMGR